MPGHWEGDLLFGSRNSQIATLVERQTRYVMLAKVASQDTETVVDALIKNARKLPQELEADRVPRIRRIGVVGAGVMGAGIVQLASLKGFDVVIQHGH